MGKRRNAAVNQKYKDTVFRMLFSDRQNLLSLYNAVNGRDYRNPEELEIVTLDSAIYMGMKNDLAFIIDTNLYLYEHQSTYNPNIPLRDLFYIASEYQKLVDHKSLYSTSAIKIPAPKFVVFYNGRRNTTDKEEICLSAMYENEVERPALELVVTLLNINEGRNRELMEQCRILREYAQYVARVRSYVGDMSLEDAVNRAVEECIREGILKEFLRKNRAEVVMVSIFEYDKEEEEKKLRKAEYEYGKQEGIKEGIRGAIFDFLQENGTIPENVRTCILKEQNEKVLRKWSKLAAHTGSIEEFWKSIEKEQDHEPDTNTVI